MLRAALFFMMCLHKIVWGGVVYSVGYLGSGVGEEFVYNATLWITDVETGNTITVELDNNATPFGIASLGNQLFIIGDLVSGTDTSAYLWITSLQGAVKKKLPLTSSPSVATSIIAYNNKLFVTGYQKVEENDIAALWILNRDGSIYKTAQLSLSEGYNASQGTSLAISNNQLFITGSQNDGFNPNATLWILDTEGNLSNTLVFGESEVNSNFRFIEVNNNKLYITGSNTGDAFLWITSLEGQVLTSLQLDSSDIFSSGTSLAIFNNRIYVAGGLFEFGDVSNAKLWIRELDGANYKAVTVGSDDEYSFASSVKPFKNLILVGGSTGASDPAREAVIWVFKPDGSLSKTIPLGLPGAEKSFVSAIYVLDENSKTLENAFKTFSPLKYQKGL